MIRIEESKRKIVVVPLINGGAAIALCDGDKTHQEMYRYLDEHCEIDYVKINEVYGGYYCAFYGLLSSDIRNRKDDKLLVVYGGINECSTDNLTSNGRMFYIGACKTFARQLGATITIYMGDEVREESSNVTFITPMTIS